MLTRSPLSCFRIDAASRRFLDVIAMKAMFGVLLCFVFITTQAFAISGGPWGRDGGVNVTGTYAGVLVPIPQANPAPPPPTVTDDSLALFTLKIPQTGGGAGQAVIFRKGIFYAGIIDAVGDPDSGKISAVISATVAVTVTCNDCNGVAHDYMYTLNANGKFETVKAVASQQSVAASSVRLRGTASLTYVTDAMNACDPGCVASLNAASGASIQYHVKGFKQSDSSS